VTHVLEPGRKGWVQVVRGAVTVNGEAVSSGDGVAVKDEPGLAITSRANGAELLVFDLP
jgi:quercetin 2,3-dioxygenase